jgi:hypothetical protein
MSSKWGKIGATEEDSTGVGKILIFKENNISRDMEFITT